ITIATVFALGVTVLSLSSTVAAAQEQAATPTAAPVLPAKPAINLNTATLDQLETLPGIGRKTAERILEYRTKSGGFKRIEDLMNAKGNGEKTFPTLQP